MSIEMPEGMDDVQEAYPLEEATYLLRIKSCVEGTAADGVTPQAIFIFVCDEQPKAAPIKFWLTWPKPEDSPEGREFKKLQLARAAHMVGRLEGDAFDGDAFLDKEFTMKVTQRTLDNSDTIVNDLFLPRLPKQDG